MSQNEPARHPAWSELLREAVTIPGRIHEAYTAFWNYSLGNQILALSQCYQRNLKPGPLATFNGWKEKNRSVKKGERALELCMPLTCKREAEDGEEQRFTRFTFKRRWFVLGQTEGEELERPEIPRWDERRALRELDVREIPYDDVDGNIQGYATGRCLAVNPLAAHPARTLFHELGHILLGHTAEASFTDDARTPRNLREVEAESVAMLCCATLDLRGVEYSRGYIQNWWGQNDIPEASAQKIFKAADQILKAGRAG